MPTARSTYIYLIIVLALLAFILFFDNKIQGTKDREEAENQLYHGLKDDDVTGLEITNNSGTFVFQRVGGHWEIKSPITTVADDGAVGEVLGAITNAQVLRNIPISDGSADTIANLKEWGLTPPAERVILHLADKTSHELSLGRKTAINESVYARSSQQTDDPVRIVNLSLKTTLEKTLSDFRSRNIFAFNPESISKIEAQTGSSGATPAQTYEVAVKDKQWHLQKPIVARATSEGVTNILQKILGLRAIDFITDNPSNLSLFGLTAPTATLSVTLSASTKDEDILLQIGTAVPGKPDQVYAQKLNSNSVFTVLKSNLDDVFHALPNVRDLHIFPFTPSLVTDLSFSFQGKRGEVKSHDSLWSTVGLTPGDADIGKVTDLLNKLGDLQTTPVIKDSTANLDAYGLDDPQGKITLVSSAAGSPLELFIGKHQDKLIYVRNSQDPFVYTLADTALDFLPKSNLELRDLRAVNLSSAQIKTISVTPEGSPMIVLSRHPDQTWSVTSPAGREVDSRKAEKFCELATQLQAKMWLGPVLPSYHLDQPQLKIALQTGTDTCTLLIGNTLPDTTHAVQILGQDLAFAITDGDYSLLSTSALLPKTAPSPSPMTNAASVILKN